MKVYEFGDKNAPAQGEIHIFYALKMGEKYRNRYLRSGRRKFSIRFSDDKKLDGFNRPIFVYCCVSITSRSFSCRCTFSFSLCRQIKKHITCAATVITQETG